MGRLAKVSGEIVEERQGVHDVVVLCISTVTYFCLACLEKFHNDHLEAHLQRHRVGRCNNPCSHCKIEMPNLASHNATEEHKRIVERHTHNFCVQCVKTFAPGVVHRHPLCRVKDLVLSFGQNYKQNISARLPDRRSNYAHVGYTDRYDTLLNFFMNGLVGKNDDHITQSVCEKHFYAATGFYPNEQIPGVEKLKPEFSRCITCSGIHELFYGKSKARIEDQDYILKTTRENLKRLVTPHDKVTRRAALPRLVYNHEIDSFVKKYGLETLERNYFYTEMGFLLKEPLRFDIDDSDDEVLDTSKETGEVFFSAHNADTPFESYKNNCSMTTDPGVSTDATLWGKSNLDVSAPTAASTKSSDEVGLGTLWLREIISEDLKATVRKDSTLNRGPDMNPRDPRQKKLRRRRVRNDSQGFTPKGEATWGDFLQSLVNVETSMEELD